VSLLLIMAGLWLPTTEGPEIKLPRSWVLGLERSNCTLRQSDILKLLGRPDSLSSSGWLFRWHYARFGVWFVWECLVVCYCLADSLGPEAMALLCRVTPLRARPLVWVVGVRVMARESLVEFGWSAWGLKAVWQFK
jgi:hypothetical protein